MWQAVRLPLIDRSRTTSKRGSSLIQILLALALFVIAGVGITGSYMAMHDFSDYATKSMRAVSDLQALVEHVQSTAFQNVATVFPAGVADGGAGQPYATLIGGYSLQNEHMTVTYPSQTADRLEITITLSWAHRTRTLTKVFSTIRARG